VIWNGIIGTNSDVARWPDWITSIFSRAILRWTMGKCSWILILWATVTLDT
jgi:hypothetical protein